MPLITQQASARLVTRRSENGGLSVVPGTDALNARMQRLLAETASAAALAAAGPNYASIALGNAATVAGEAFAVDNGDGTISVFMHGAAVAGDALRTLIKDPAASTAAGLLGTTTSTVQDGLDKLPRSPQYDDGAHSDGVTADDTAFAASLAGSKSIQLDASHALISTHDLAYDQSLKGFGRSGKLVVPAAAALDDDVVLRLNALTDLSGWVQQYPNAPGSDVGGFEIDATAASAAGQDITAIAFGGSPRFTNLKLRGVVRGFQAVGLYNDQVRFEQIHFPDGNPEQPAGVYYFELGLGDGIVAEGVEISQYLVSNADPNTHIPANGFLVSQCAGGSFSRIINGRHTFQVCKGILVANSHFENGGITFNNTVGTIHDCAAWRRQDGTYTDAAAEEITLSGYDQIPYQITSTVTEMTNTLGQVVIRNTLVVYWPNMPGGFPVGGYDLLANGRTPVVVENCARAVGGLSGAVGPQTLLGWLAATSDGAEPTPAISALASFNNYSHFASVKSRLVNGKVFMCAEVPAFTAPAGLGAGGGADSRRTWGLSTTTWYFKTQILLDPVRLDGVTSTTERSYSLTNGGSGVRLDLAGPDFPHIQRVHFGTSSGSYRYYVDIPVIAGRLIYGDGLDFEGFAVIDRGAASAMGTINEHLLGGFTLHPGDNGSSVYGRAECWTASTTLLFPAVGTWAQGDQIYGPGATALYNGSAWGIVGGTPYVNADMGNAALNISTNRNNGGLIRANTPLTADRTLTLPAPANVIGATYRVNRTAAASGAFNINVFDGTSVIKAMAAGTGWEFTATATGYVLAQVV